ncbi:MAG TPA: S8 family peptidase, partial [Blastocatellia bacterium]|nr:S8 family peptidase [Blastocatellia bacterium]
MKKIAPYSCILTLALFVAGVFVFLRGNASANSNESASWRYKVSPDLLGELDRGDQNAECSVIATASGRLTKYHEDVLGALGARLFPGRALGLINGVSATMPLRAVKELAKRNDFSHISKDRPVKMLGHLENTTGAAQIRNLISGIPGLNGSGIGIAILDSGIDESHHELNYAGSDRVVVDVDAGGFGNTFDFMGHGTHVASVACGTNHIGPGAYTGIAPGANIINVKVLDVNGTGYASQIINAINWCVTYRDVYNIRIINLSLGTAAVDSYQNDPLCQAVRAAHDAGVVVVVAAGNDGKDAKGNKLYGTIESPGIEPSAITVGAANTYGTDSRADDGITSYSSRGPTRGYVQDAATGQTIYDNLIKPDLVAPGNKIIAAEAYGADLVADYPQLDASQYETNPHHYLMCMSGTSVSAPVVSGAAALLLQENPNLTPNQVKAILTYTAQPLAGFNTLEQGAGEVNIDGAVRVARLVKNLGSWALNGQQMLNGSLPV